MGFERLRAATRHSRVVLLISATLGGGAGLVASSAYADEVDARLERMREHLAGCTQKHGYDPDGNIQAGEHELAPGEASWRNCAYDGIRSIMMPDSSSKAGYRYLIAFDRTLTQQIEAGKLTRDKRQERLQKAVDDALAQDRATSSGASATVGAGAAADQAKQEAQIQSERDEAVRRSREAQKLRDIQSLMR